MSHEDVVRALTGLLVGLFVAILSSNVVSNALPRMVADLGGGQSAVTWIVTSALLATTVSTPIWGKLADLLDRKRLVQIALAIFVVGSLIGGLAPNLGVLIVGRVLQGAGAGGAIALTQVILAAMVSPRERGRYQGYFGAVMACAFISGPLIGGLIVDTPGLGWHWVFFLGVPVALVAMVVVARTLHVPQIRREVRIDYLGAILIVAGVSALLIYVSLAGHQFGWFSAQGAVLVLLGVVLVGVAIRVEAHAPEPIIPLRLFRYRTVVLSVTASLLIGVGLFSSTTFISQYFQLAQGRAPMQAGLLTLPLVIAQLSASVLVGRLVSSTGHWKRFLVFGASSLTAGAVLLSQSGSHSSYALLFAAMVLIGAGIGSTLQNLVLCIQNTIDPADLGAGSSTAVFFRTLGGAVGVSVLGALLGAQVSSLTAQGLSAAGIAVPAGDGEAKIPDIATLPEATRAVVESAYSSAIGTVFLVVAPLLLLALVAILAIRETALRTESGTQQQINARQRLDALRVEESRVEESRAAEQRLAGQPTTPAAQAGAALPSASVGSPPS